MASTLFKQLSTLKSMSPSGKGITTVLKNNLRRNKVFRPPRPKCRGVTAKKGKLIGIRTDNLFTRAIRKKIRIDPSNPSHDRCHNLFIGLKRRGIKCVRSQFRVSKPELGIWTDIDAIGINGNMVYVIELKCTQYTLEQHKDMYDKSCLNKHKLSNGIINTERNAHALQTGFGMMALKTLLPNSTIKGLVVVCTCDGAKMYDVDPYFSDEKHFQVSSLRPQLGSYVKTVQFQPLPKRKESLDVIAMMLKKHGYPFKVLSSFSSKYGSFTISVSAKAYLVVALCLSEGGVGNKKQRQLSDDITKLWLDKKKKVKVNGCILEFSSGTNPVHHVWFSPRSHLPG